MSIHNHISSSIYLNNFINGETYAEKHFKSHLILWTLLTVCGWRGSQTVSMLTIKKATQILVRYDGLLTQSMTGAGRGMSFLPFFPSFSLPL